MIDEVTAIVNTWVDFEAPLGKVFEYPWERGSVKQDDRMLGVAQLCATYHGDFAEIGCLRGNTTSGLGRLARELNRRVIACDPWEPGLPNCSGDHEYEDFLENTAAWRDLIDIVRLRSEHPDAIAYLLARPLCFAYVDGFHDYEHCRRDIVSTQHARVVCVDDLWVDGVRQAFEEAAGAKVWNPRCKEGYLIR